MLMMYLCYQTLIIFLCVATQRVTSVDGSEHHHLPIIDLRDDAKTIAFKLHTAATTVGFFYLVGHNISKELQQQVFNKSKHFFNLEQREKEK